MKTSIVNQFRLWSVLITLCLPLFIQAGVEPELKNFLTGAGIVNNATFSVSDLVFLDAAGNQPVSPPPAVPDPSNPGSWYLQSCQNEVTLEINQQTINDCVLPNFSLTLTVAITRHDQFGQSLGTINKNLTIDYDNAQGNKYKEKHSFTFTGGYYTHVQITNVGNPGVVNYATIYTSTVIERYRDIDLTVAPTFNTGTYNPQENAITIDWQTIDKAEEYDLEWTWIDDIGPNGVNLSKSVIEYSFENNASRVSIKNTNYTVSAAYEQGYLLFRVRAVGLGGNGFEQRINGKWSSDDYCSTIECVGSSDFTDFEDMFYLENGAANPPPAPGTLVELEHQLTWQYSVVFAEEGMKKEVISYFDGSLRSRQSVTRLNTEIVSVVGEQVYDYQGRPAINILPVPTGDNAISYHPDFNLNTTTNVPYSRSDFDEGGDCSRSIDAMSDWSGSSKYYSTQNPQVGNMHYEYIASAQGFPFAVTEFMPDNTGRVRRQGGVGIDHQLGSNHETKYYYAVPEQVELDRLFGNAVGYSDHYEKNMVIDPNGQVSVSYLDASGRTVATALAGAKPESVEEVSGIGMIQTVTSNILSDTDLKKSKDKSHVSKTFPVPVQGNYVFDYSVQVPRHTDATQPTLCFDCVYDLTISLLDECGNEMFDGDPLTPGNQAIVRTLGKPTPNFDTGCETGSLDYSFSGDADLNNQAITVNLSIGTYTITKTLTINEQAVDYYADQFVSNNASLQTEEDFINTYLAEIDYSRCGVTCESCVDDLGTKAAFSTDEQAKLVAQGHTVTQKDLDRIDAHYDELLQFCDRLCEDYDDECNIYLQTMLADVRPGGQYASYDLKGDGDYDDEFYELLDISNTTHALRFNYQYSWDGNGNTTILDWKLDNVPITVTIADPASGDKISVLPSELSPLDFIKYFDDSWAEYLVQFHPEYCSWEACTTYVTSNEYDALMLGTETYADALAAGYLNPTNRTDISGLYPKGTKDPLWTILTGTEESDMNTLMDAYIDPDPGESACTKLSFWDLCVAQYVCADEQFCNDLNSCISNNPWSSINCAPYQDMMWRMFRGMYLAEKAKVKEAIIAQDQSCPRTSSMTGYTKRFYETGDAEGMFTDISNETYVKNDAVTGINDFCDDACEGQADNWMQKLEGCNMSEADADAMKADLIKICQNACDENNPLGASNIPGGRTKRVATQYNSFEEVFNAYAAAGKLTKVDAICDINLISSPLAYGHNTSMKQKNTGCESVSDASRNGCILDEENDELREAMVGAFQSDTGCEKCINCDELWEAINYVQSKYNGGFVDDNFAKQEVITKLINEYHSLNLSYNDYYDFARRCMGENDTFYRDSMLWYYYDQFAYNQAPFGSLKLEQNGPFNGQPLYKGLNNKDLWPEFAHPETEWASVNGLWGPQSSVPDTVDLASCHCDQLEQQMQAWLLGPPVRSEPLSQNDIADFNEEMACWEETVAPAFDYYSLLKKCRDAYAMDGGQLGMSNVWTQKKKMALAYLVAIDTLELPDCFPCAGDSIGESFYRPTDRYVVDCDSFLLFLDSFLQANNKQQLIVELTHYLYDRDDQRILSDLATFEALMDDFYVDFPHAYKDTTDSTTLEEIKSYLLDYLPCLILKDVPTDSCCMEETVHARRLKDVLNALTESKGALGNHFVYDDWLAVPSLEEYYMSPLYDSVQCKNSLLYRIEKYDMPTLTYQMADTCGDTTSVTLSYINNLNNSAYFGNITRFFNFRPVSDVNCDSAVHYFNVDIDQIMMDGRSFKTTLVGYAPDWVLYDTCKPDTILLCDKDYSLTISTIDPCSSRLESLAKHQAIKAYNDYIKQKKHDFREAYKAKCREAFLSETFSRTWDIQEYHYTLYYYDQANNLIQTVPPAGVQLYTSQGDLDAIDDYRKTQAGSPLHPNHTLPTQYAFNSLNQLVRHNTPDGGQSEFWYDAQGRMVVAQNAQQATSFDYSYTKYDERGRIEEVGELNNNSGMSWQTAFDEVALDGFISGAVSHKEVTKTLYDEDQLGISYNSFGQENLRNRVASMLYWDDMMDPTYKQGVHYSYDIHGNVQSVLRENTDLATIFGPPIVHQYKQIDYKYDLISGNVNTVIYEPGDEDQFIHKYEYDADNRIQRVYTSTNGIHYDKEAEYFYYQHGPLMRTELGQLKVQGLDYAYTIHGWIKGVNSNTLKDNRDIGKDGDLSSVNNQVAQDVFGYSLGYFGNDYNAIGDLNGTIAQSNHFLIKTAGSDFDQASAQLFNGNIRHMVTAIQPFLYGNGEPQGMTYTYDQLNRIKKAEAWNNVDVNLNGWQSGGAAMPDYGTEYSYDPNGNITNLTRNGYSGTNVQMDQFTYNYTPGTNQLDYVTDNVAAGNYAEDIDNQTAGNYTYDLTGNLVQDMAEQIQTIEWTVYGKIESIVRTPGSTKADLEFEYTPDGHRCLKRVHHKDPGGNIISFTETYYIRDASGNIMATYERTEEEFKWQSSPIYGSSRLGVYEADQTLVQNGVAVGSSLASNEFEHKRGKRRYELSNHLGNVLVVVSDKRTHTCITGTTFDHYAAEIISANDYYPFGMIMPNRTYSNGAYRFGFNGKEKDDETAGAGNSLDFDARIYSSRLGRWMGLDPLAFELCAYSPYHFSFCSPLMFMDDDGKKGTIVIYAQRPDGSKYKIATYQVEGHETGTVEETKTRRAFWGDWWSSTERVRTNAYDFKQEIVMVMDGKGNVVIQEGKRQRVGPPVASSSRFFFQTAHAKNKARRLDRGKDLLYNFKIRSMTDFEEWVWERMDEDEINNLIEAFSYTSDGPSTPKHDEKQVVVSENSIELELQLQKMIDVLSADGSCYCQHCKKNYKVRADGSLTELETDEEPQDSVINHSFNSDITKQKNHSDDEVILEEVIIKE